MKPINRRTFLSAATRAAGAAWVLSQLPTKLFAGAAALNIPVGFQTYPIRDILVKDFAGTLKMMAGMGYQITEMCSPKGYVDSGFGPLVNMKTSDMRKIINDAGLSCPSCHFGFEELNNDLDDRIQFAKDLGLTYMICSSYDLPKTATLNDWLAASEKLNQAAEKIKNAGMQAGYNNHEMEFAQLDGQLI